MGYTQCHKSSPSQSRFMVGLYRFMSFGCPGCPHLFHPFPCHAAHRSCLATAQRWSKRKPLKRRRTRCWRDPPRDTWGRNSKPEKRKKKLEKKGENPERKSCAECASEFVKSWRIQLSKHVCGEGVWKICSS